jgi:hypothetical protein
MKRKTARHVFSLALNTACVATAAAQPPLDRTQPMIFSADETADVG